MNNSCYYKKVLNFDNGMFDEYIDVAYLLTMENSKRKEHYMEQLNKYKPHKKIIIQSMSDGKVFLPDRLRGAQSILRG